MSPGHKGPVPSALATVLTPSFDLPLISSFLMYEARGGAIRQRVLWKTSFQTHSFAMGPQCAGKGKRPLLLSELLATQKTPFESQAGKAGTVAAWAPRSRLFGAWKIPVVSA